MKIAVIGAGIGGLVAAVGLQRNGHDVVVYEQRDDPSPAGAGLTLFGNAFDALDMVGLGEVVRGVSSGAIGAMRAGQREPSGAWLMTTPPAAVASLRSAHRVELHRVLTEALQPGTLHVGTPALVSDTGSPEVSVDGRTERFDVVVVADGIRSRNRAALGLDTGVRYAGYTAWRGVTGAPVALGGEAGETWGRGRVFGVVPLPDERVYWFATLSTPANTVFPNEHEAVLSHFAKWHAPIRACIDATPPDQLLRHDIHDLAKLPTSFRRGRTVLLGDAAHAMTPNLGQGAGQAIEDAVTLALLLDGARADIVEERLDRYAEVRRRRTVQVWQRSRFAGRIAQTAHPLAAGLRDAVLRLTPSRAMSSMSRSLLAWPKPTT
ncbi:MAG: FAD-dependent monooxygenase [Trueperaceae bacterium]|nr:FAD-dependent monooxygenase [Trueperaceae bacterium]